ncbi:NAD-dependent deacylase [Actinoplanes bogorensis]|uniref:NAD-dependent protein deacylase n=1 Tax=Paractinoplanes bogorensis TaxID=1610840 RepID=A0ABS5YUS3_9ACTN|nr:NAD-dependent deacylase [Actinoplanes bogorensis]MBU2666424.1 NAD-dependent deacylase [Actinoplanes bogorensis]
MDPLDHAAELIAGAQRLVVFTGAGMSAESGVPTFRDALTGLWEQYDAQELATPEAFERDPALVWGWYEWRRELVERVSPNAGHDAVARLDCTLITQNVDDLHERAGSKNVVHLHGSLFAPRCSACGRPADGALPGNPPACAHCEFPVRPGVVWFGEALPMSALKTAVESAADADVLVTVGTSGLVYPAAEIPHVTAKMGGTVIQVNPQATPLDEACAINLRGTAGEVLPKIIR